jgi:predicted PurR-regulated permease PerM
MLRRRAVDEAAPRRPRAHAGVAPPPPLGETLTAEDVRPRGLAEQPLVRTGIYAWSLIGAIVLVVAGVAVVAKLAVVVVPLVLALFPAAVLAPPTQRLRARGVPPAAATSLVIVGFLVLLAAVFGLLAPIVAAELGDLGERLEEGYERVRAFLESGPFGLEPVSVGALVERAREQLTASDELGSRVGEYLIAVVEGFAGVILGLLALFFYLKDGDKIARWLRDLFPKRARRDAEAIGERAWLTIGGYIRGQLLIALVDAVLIGIGLLVLRVPLVLPLAVLVFFGGLFPIVGAFVAGAVAVLVALATSGVAKALLVLVLIVAVQQVEGHVLAPIVLGRATQLHPLAVIAALAAGGVLLGVLGAFLAVPVAASVARGVGYLRERVPG